MYKFLPCDLANHPHTLLIVYPVDAGSVVSYPTDDILHMVGNTYIPS
ncbi:protein of unknown function [Clostridium beijerinckii]|nr:protein of unknown function [Clostridium beijerinckii]